MAGSDWTLKDWTSDIDQVDWVPIMSFVLLTTSTEYIAQGHGISTDV